MTLSHGLALGVLLGILPITIPGLASPLKLGLAGGPLVVAILLSGRRDRLEESVILRTLGASRQQIRRILVSEYLLLGTLASLTGGILATGYAFLLAKFAFDVPFTTVLWPLAAAILIVATLTTALGMFLSRGIASHPPLAILRGSD
jgi:putative ABC transport system permease protein